VSVEIRLWSGEQEIVVGLRKEGDATVADVAGAAHRIRVAAPSPRAVAAGATVEEVGFELADRPVRALVARLRDRVLVAVAGRTYVFETGEAARRGGDAGKRSGKVAAPMPGKVVTVLVQVGDTVDVGQPLVVLEAMKMESTLVAEVAGKVTAVAAVQGTTVEGGAVLVEIADAAA
jgi:3-methylcrotonyl-CoA carboxylase alpha subunit